MKTETQKPTFEMAPAPIPFLENEYFTGLCELAVASKLEKPVYIPAKSKGIFESLYFKRIFGRILQENGSYLIGNFNTNNKYLANEDGSIRETNFAVFTEKTKALTESQKLTVFSFEPIKTVPALEDLF